MKIQCENNHTFEVFRLRTVDGELRGQNMKPLKCPECGNAKCIRLDKPTEDLPNIGAWSAANEVNKKPGHAYD